LQVYTFQILVDTFGDIPYTDALKSDIVLPKYESGSAVYQKLIARLDLAIADLDDSKTSFDSGEYIYNGDVAKWKNFANSLKVKLGINIADSDAALSKATVQSAITNGVILANADNAVFKYVTAAPNYNPVYANLVANGRNDYVPTSVIVDIMNTLVDPRSDVYFENKIAGAYKGGKYGLGNTYSNFSHIGTAIKAADAKAVLIESSEIAFLLAEAAERGYAVGNTAQFYYNAGIKNSCEYWGVSTSATNSYLLKPTVKYTTASGTWKEKIGNQSYIAMYNRGFEAWTNYRRLDFPVLIAPTKAVDAAEGEVPKRLTYPIIEQTVNGENLKAAATAIGGDNLKTKIFWDKN
jgi:hypothetical protein